MLSAVLLPVVRLSVVLLPVVRLSVVPASGRWSAIAVRYAEVVLHELWAPSEELRLDGRIAFRRPGQFGCLERVEPVLQPPAADSVSADLTVELHAGSAGVIHGCPDILSSEEQFWAESV